MLSYLSYLFRLRLLSKDSHYLEGLQSADKTKMHSKAKLQNAPTFTRNRSHCHVCLRFLIKIKSFTYHMYKQQSADTNVLIGRYRLSEKRPIIGQYRLSVHLWFSRYTTCDANCYNTVMWHNTYADMLRENIKNKTEWCNVLYIHMKVMVA